MSDLSGTQLGRYRLHDVLGTGGFATVYRATDEGLDAAVAIKILADNHSLDLEIRERFLDEGRLLRRVKHPDLLTVHDIGETPNKRPYLVLELANGGTLADRLDDRQPTQGDIDSLISVLHTGLGELHQAGIVHRDLSPSNIFIHRSSGGANSLSPSRNDGLLDSGERFAIGDLGLAKDLLRTSGITVGIGTGEFAAPEQRKPGGVVGTAADIYGASALVAHVASLAPTISRAVADATQAGLSRTPSDRPASIDEWRHAFDEPLGKGGGPTVAGSSSRSAFGSRIWMFPVAVVVIGVLGVASLIGFGRSDNDGASSVVFGQDGLSPGWTDDSWGAAKRFSLTNGSVELEPFGALSLRHDDIVTGDKWLVFGLTTEANGGNLSVRANDRNAATLAECPIPTLNVGTSRTLTVSLDSLGASQGITRVSFVTDDQEVAFVLSSLLVENDPPSQAEVLTCR